MNDDPFSMVGRIRCAFAAGMPRSEILKHMINTDMGSSPEAVFLAYHAALILEFDTSHGVNLIRYSL